jgi:hypothetical protein
LDFWFLLFLSRATGMGYVGQLSELSETHFCMWILVSLDLERRNRFFVSLIHTPLMSRGNKNLSLKMCNYYNRLPKVMLIIDRMAITITTIDPSASPSTIKIHFYLGVSLNFT